jgi:hypothetical protein
LWISNIQNGIPL